MSVLRWLASTFPRGWPGLGLLLLRVVVGATVVVQGWTMPAWGTAALAIGAGIAVALGLLTSVAAVLLGMGAMGVAFGWIPWGHTDPSEAGASTIFVVSMCFAIALLGPGAFSIDARLRGRREIVIPEDAH